MMALAAGHAVYWAAIALALIGFYAMIAHGNLLKKLIGLNILQTAVILFFIAGSAKWGAVIPIVSRAAGPAVAPERAMNPLPHALMLTAIVVMVATLGVALAVLVRLYRRYGSFEEDAILDRAE
jgi:multicomponent Na+:H+ antiporter subunit C